MGNKASQEDQIPLLDNDEVALFSQTQLVFEELNLVLIGGHGAGKNAIGNAILGENFFTFWKSLRHQHIAVTREVSRRQIRLSRTRGWKGDLKSQKTKRSIVHCVQSLYATGPHAVLLVLKVNSVLSESTISTLESLLTARLWEHTIVLFTNGEKLGDYTIEDYIRSQQLQPLIDKCGKRFTVTKKDNGQIIETIEELIASKKASSFFKILEQDEVDEKTLVSDWSTIVKNIKSKIDHLSNYKTKLREKQNEANEDQINKLIQSKDAEIKRLEKIVQEKEREIANLQSKNQLDVSELRRKIATLERQLQEKNNEIEKKDAEIEELKKELQMLQEKWRTHDDTIGHVDFCRELGQNVSAASRRSSHSHIQLQELSSKRSAQRSETLFQVLEMLSEYELKKMKHFLCWNREYKIHKSSVEDKDRMDLVDLMMSQWDWSECVQITRDLLKKIPHNNDVTIELLMPYLEAIGETW